MNRLLYKVSAGIISVALFGAVAVGPAMADNTSVYNSQQALAQQINSEVNQGELSQAQQDLQTLEQMAGYTQPATTGAISDLQIGLAQALQNGDWTVANTLLSEIQTLEATGTTTTTPTVTTPTPTTTEPTYQDNYPTYQQPTQSPTYPTYQQPTHRAYQGYIPQDIRRDNPILQQTWAQSFLQNSPQANNSDWWFWQYLREHQQHRR